MAEWGKFFGDLSKKVISAAPQMAVHGIQNTPQVTSPLYQGMRLPQQNTPQQELQQQGGYDQRWADWQKRMQDWQSNYINGLANWQNQFYQRFGGMQQPQQQQSALAAPSYQMPTMQQYQQPTMQNQQFNSMSALNPYLGQINTLRGRFG